MKPYEELQAYWRSTGGGVETVSLSDGDVDAIERRCAVVLPPDLREYLLRSCPKDDFAVDAECTAWWPRARLKSLADEYEHDIIDEKVAAHAAQYLVFADYMIWCGAWAIACVPGEDYGKVAVINGSADRFVAGSFAEFVDQYVRDCGPLM